MTKRFVTNSAGSLSIRQWKVLLGVAIAELQRNSMISSKVITKVLKNYSIPLGNIGDILSNLALKKKLLETNMRLDVSSGKMSRFYTLSQQGKDYILERLK